MRTTKGSVMQARRDVVAGLVAGALVSLAGSAGGQGQYPAMLQWFEVDWNSMERRIPDFFLAGYGATWLPPISRGLAPGFALTPGYDPLDRFELSGTTYGTEEDFRALVDEFHAANAKVYIDLIMNHNGFRRADRGFHEQGGYPGFWANPPAGRDLTPLDDWGDFHNSTTSGGYLQSTNPNDPLYDLFRGDLVALCDIDQLSQNFFIRQPTTPGDPQNIPGGTQRNNPDPANARFYPDMSFAGADTVTNPGTFRNSGSVTVTRYRWNAFDPMQGDPVVETATDLLVRHTRWLLEEVGVDGFRLDAAKHIQSSFWDRSWDNAVYNNWEHPSGVNITAYSFGESTAGNGFVYDQYIRRPNNNIRQGDEWGNRDSLDLDGAGALRNLVGANGFGTWQDPLNRHFDNVDGFNDGSLGVNHVFSHDNGSVGNGSELPPEPSRQQMGIPMNVYVLMRPGQGLIYHNQRGVNRPSGNFSPRNGVPIALGRNRTNDQLDDTITRVVQLANEVGRGDIDVTSYTDPLQPNIDDVFVFERRQRGGPANALVAVNDRRNPGFETRDVVTNFAPGTRLHEQTGNASDPMVDPNDDIPEIITVGANGRLTVNVPNNVSSAGAHENGFVIYSPALPTAAMTFSGGTGVLPPEPFFVPDYAKRVNTIEVVQGASFDLEILTSQTDPLDADTDDNALFRIGEGYEDYNGNGVVDFPTGMQDFNNNGVLEFPQEENIIGGFEQFLTVNEPLFDPQNPGRTQGRYVQTIPAGRLDEGLNYITARVFRHRDDGGDPIYRELRKVVYVDNEAPTVSFVDQPEVIESRSATFEFRANDRTATSVVVLANLDPAIDAVEFARTRPIATQLDRFDWSFSFLGLPHGPNTLTVVTFEETGRGGAQTFDFFVDVCPGDVNMDGVTTDSDFFAWVTAFIDNDPRGDVNRDGTVNDSDFFAWVTEFTEGCS
ncbi:MAG: alpha-amylase family glycosyl hydrolase [Planctomycetota bacterium]